MRQKNQYYMTRGKSGEECVYKTPADLLQKGYAYFNWCATNPWNKTDLLKSGDKKGELVDLPIGRPFTIKGLCVFCGLSEKSFATLKADSQYAPVVEHLCAIVAQHQIEGATLGVYNANLVVRLQGVCEQEATPTDGKVLEVNVLDDSTRLEMDRLLARLKTGAVS